MNTCLLYTGVLFEYMFALLKFTEALLNGF